jgi:hypothetical protein
MDDNHWPAPQRSPNGNPKYDPPTVTYVGDLADLTRQIKDVGAADGATFLGIDLGSV